VRICRAAFGALEKLLCGALYFEMEKRSGPASSRRAWRWAREIAIAVLLTVAAAGFITVALVRGNGGSHTPPSFETARKPAGP
jgi:cytochrome bd-type quinol oxidase subunit 2